MAGWAMAAIAGASAVDQRKTGKRAEKRANQQKADADKKLAADKKKRAAMSAARGNRAQQRVAAERSVLERGSGSYAKTAGRNTLG